MVLREISVLEQAEWVFLAILPFLSVQMGQGKGRRQSQLIILFIFNCMDHLRNHNHYQKKSVIMLSCLCFTGYRVGAKSTIKYSIQNIGENTLRWEGEIHISFSSLDAKIKSYTVCIQY